jgi:hypothetical protein
MKLIRVKVYQAVYLGKNLESMFPGRKNPKVEIELLEGIGVQISDKNNTVIVPFPNVAYIEVEKAESKSKANGKTKI